MRGRRTAALVAGAAATMVLAAWVSASGPVGIFARPALTGYQAPAPGTDYGPAEGDPDIGRVSAPGPADGALVQLLDLLMKAIVVAVLVAVLVAIARELRRRWLERERPTADEVTVAMTPEVLLARTRASEELLTRGAPRHAVVAAWVSLEDALREAGIRDDATRTSAEVVRAVLRQYAVSAEPLDRLAALYREARFSRHEIGEDMREQAGDALRQIQADLASAPRHAGARR